MRRPTSKYRTPPVPSRRELYLDPVIISAKNTRSLDGDAETFETCRGMMRKDLAVFGQQCAATLPNKVTTDTTEEQALAFVAEVKGLVPDVLEG